MSGFTEDWLAAREPLDHEVRSSRLADAFAGSVGTRPRLLDLGTGTGSNIRYLAPRLGVDQSWIALDHDPALLDSLRRSRGLPVEVVPCAFDLSDPGRLDLGEVDGVTAAALLDLASAGWLERLAARIDHAGTPALFALSFDGRLRFGPEDEEDDEVRRRFLLHQRFDKGFGPALGPAAVGHLAERLERTGRTVDLEAADWHLSARWRRLTLMFLEGLRQVFRETAGPSLAGWLARRGRELEAGRLEIVVGHQDLLAR